MRWICIAFAISLVASVVAIALAWSVFIGGDSLVGVGIAGAVLITLPAIWSCLRGYALVIRWVLTSFSCDYDDYDDMWALNPDIMRLSLIAAAVPALASAGCLIGAIMSPDLDRDAVARVGGAIAAAFITGCAELVIVCAGLPEERREKFTDCLCKHCKKGEYATIIDS